MRTEKDSIGEIQIPDDALYGAQTARAVENFKVSGRAGYREFIYATVQIKKAAAIVHQELRLLDKKQADAIIKATDEVLSGKYDEHFVVDVFQAGAGTSHHMNVNEVLANLANISLGGKLGKYEHVHPNDHVNMAQSTNDVIPTAIRLAALELLKYFYPTLQETIELMGDKAKKFDEIIKSARTHLQDAVPIRLGQEFGGYADNLAKHLQNIKATAEELKKLGIGGSAAGTGLNVHPEYRQKMAETLSKLIDMDLKMADNYFEAMQSMRPFVNLSGSLRGLASDLGRIANDFRLLSSGPRTGLREINLPTVQPGSSIMPGKVNPVLAEMLNMVCYRVIGNDLTIANAGGAGQLDLNVMMPLIADTLVESLRILTGGLRSFNDRCLKNVTANPEKCKDYAENSFAMVTALNTVIGYLKAAEVAKESEKSGKPIRQIVVEKGYLKEDELDKYLSPEKLTEPGIPGKD
ncbi:MAG: aspartate ammonia-lyase [candidate division Zixibacteria bacterium]|nr:aspartate ammonia-lyase [candidate division Zixibacteria bacterium]NIR64522.1 aspartate ammonia-lyase [candidate division Zixibacteria bacterium]NIS16591.1 aspartate ammonia-lyase [candidate division Zixibacteria bacterium]NIS46299.1 aspartate ammonia-lyase [candidate division Zixibacteria bacterium]NIT52953.1 aspartate ammonia-lyase [candidate division Zixibacteria bacterium]